MTVLIYILFLIVSLSLSGVAISQQSFSLFCLLLVIAIFIFFRIKNILYDENNYTVEYKLRYQGNNYSHNNYGYNYGNNNQQQTYSTYNQSYRYANEKVIHSDAKKLAKKMHLSTNFIEFSGEKKMLVTPTKVSKKSSSMDIQNQTPKQTNGFDFIMIDNDDFIPQVKIDIYNIIIKYIESLNLDANQKYALLQSFYYIDVSSKMIIIYFDYNIINKAKLSFDLYKQDLINKIKLEKQDMTIMINDLKTPTLLNFYLEKNGK